MVNIWLIRPGEEARLWEEFQNKKCIAIGWEADSYSKYQSLADVKQQYGSNDANSIWYFYKDMKIGDIAVAIKGQKRVLGIGKITSEYIEPNDPQNPGIEYGHVRLVEWVIIDEIENLSYNFPQKTITPVKEDWKWEEVKKAYMKKDEKYKEIFDKLNSRDKMNLPQMIKLFISKLDSDELTDHRNEHKKRSQNVRNKLTKENVSLLTEDEMLYILNNTEAAYGARFDLRTIFSNNGGFDNFKANLVELLERTELDESDVNEIFGSFNNLGPGFLTELLCLRHPDKFWMQNSVVNNFFSYRNIDLKKNLPRGSKGNKGKIYLAMQSQMSGILQELKNNGLKDATYMDVDLFIVWLQNTDDSIFVNTTIDFDANQYSELNNVLSHTKNVILYGPPGTGKTFTVQQFINEFLKEQLLKPKSYDQIKAELLRDLTLYEIVALAIYVKGKDKKLKLSDIKNDELVKYYYGKLKGKTRNVGPILASVLPKHANPDSETINYKSRHGPMLFDKTTEGEWYLLPDGIDYVETNLSEAKDLLMGEKTISEEKTLHDFCTFITFHQSYGYEDFIEGLKPVVNDNGDVSYRVEAGVFKEISERARHDPENNYVLVIDEINRGNIAKIFGELITLIEDDKRSEANKNGLSVKLPYSKTEFSVPSNLYILGTMNTADRSIALLDIALRRRFTFLEIMPDYSIIEFDVDGVNISSLLEGLNIMVSALIDRDHQIGHSYFCDLAGLEEDLAKDKLYFIWYKKIIPLLQEYFYNDWEQLKLILGDFVLENGTSKVPALKDKIVNKSYEIRDFEGDWDTFSRALKRIYGEEKEFTLAEDSVESAFVADSIEE